MLYHDGDLVNTHMGWGEISSDGVKRLYVKVFLLNQNGHKWIFQDNVTKIYNKDITDVIHCEGIDYKKMWKKVGFRVLDENTLVSIHNQTEIGAYDSYSDDSENETSSESMHSFIVADTESETSSYVHVSPDLECRNGQTAGQTRFMKKIMQIEKRLR